MREEEKKEEEERLLTVYNVLYLFFSAIDLMSFCYSFVYNYFYY